MNCQYCEEPVLPGEQSHIVANASMHRECAFRLVIGSVGHIRKMCRCYGGTEEDPTGMTKRQAAKAALEEFNKLKEHGITKNIEAAKMLGQSRN